MHGSCMLGVTSNVTLGIVDGPDLQFSALLLSSPFREKLRLMSYSKVPGGRYRTRALQELADVSAGVGCIVLSH